MVSFVWLLCERIVRIRAAPSGASNKLPLVLIISPMVVVGADDMQVMQVRVVLLVEVVSETVK